jgi:thymidylate synthase
MKIISNNIDDIYRQICSKLCDDNTCEIIHNTRELTNACFELTDINNNIVNIRGLSRAYLFGELTWYMTAREDMAFINKFAGLWGRISDNGVTSNSAYGHILFVRHGFNQVEKIIELLKKDPNSRRAVLNFNVPNENVIETKDEICTIALQFLIRDNKLYCTGIMRSNDIWYGTPYDVTFFTELQKYIAHRLNVEYGTYTHFAVSLHVYDRNFEEFKKVLRNVAETRMHVDIEKLASNAQEIADRIDYVYQDDPKRAIVELFDRYEIYYEEEYK